MALLSRVVSRSHSLEPLESRIAPALLIIGANLLVAGSGTSVGETSVGDNNAEVVKVTSGSAIVWYDGSEITAISFGPNTSLEIQGSVGTLIGNLLPNGRLSDTNNDPSDGEDGEVLLRNNLIGLKVTPLIGHEAVVGSIITGGSVQNVTVDGRISGIYAGDGAFQSGSSVLSGGIISVPVGLDYNPITPGVDDTFDLTLAAAQSAGLLPGASVKNVKIVKAASLQIFAGNGDPNGNATGKGAAGGSISNVFIETAFSPATGDGISYELRAGTGASGTTGGAGGSITKLVEKSSGGQVLITAGDGGDGTAGAGGAGGSITDIDIQSDSAQYLVHAGAGGSGAPGGAGGSVKNASFANRTPVGGVVLAADFTGDGKDDVLVADQGTGSMIVYQNVGDGSNFVPIEQYRFEDMPVYLINSLNGETPVDAAAVDFDSDGDLDIVIAYKNSNSVSVFFNQDNKPGTFWDPQLNEEAGGFSEISTGLQISPSKIAPLDAGGGRIAVAGIAGGKGALQLLTKGFDSDGFTLNVADGLNTLKFTVSDIVASRSGALFMATSDGKIQQLTVSGLEKQPFNVTDTGIAISGGIDDLDFDSEGTRLLALSTARKTLTVFQVNAAVGEGLLTNSIQINLSELSGKPLVAKFIRDNSSGADRIAILNSISSGARMDLFNPIVQPGSDVATSYAFARSLTTTQTLNRFVPAYSNSGAAGFAGLGGSLTDFTYGDDFLQLKDYTLPFAKKEVSVMAGDGGTGMDFAGKKPGKGGAGGSITGLNADAFRITATAGNGGDSGEGAAGAGGSISNKKKFNTVSGVSLKPMLITDSFITLVAGNGGTPTLAGKKASGGAGGSISDIAMQVSAGELITLQAGNGGSSRGAAAGNGGGISSITTTTAGGNFYLTAGFGGEALANTGAGGAGGSVSKVSHISTLEEEAELNEVSTTIEIVAGAGGISIGAAGGNGGSVGDITISIDEPNITYDDPEATPPKVDAERDSTVYVNVVAGDGARGAKGGIGGNVTALKYDSVFDQYVSNAIFINYHTLSITAGAGGEGTISHGGNGGSIILKKPISGITRFDPDATLPANNPDAIGLLLQAGAGGKGADKGGNGGSISGLIAQNSQLASGGVVVSTMLESARLRAGDGGEGGTGNGGAGGSITGSLVGVQGMYIDVLAGAGGNSLSAKGGAGGSITKSEYGVVSTWPVFNAGMLLAAGNGGNGVKGGGAGGAVSGIKVNTSQSTIVPSALIIAGAGGNANSATGVGGAGGDVSGISQVKDVNSSINLIQAGNGGDNPLGKAGKGGSVSEVRTVGFIGRPSNGFNALGAFDSIKTELGVNLPEGLMRDNGDGTATFAQGLYVGRGGAGQTDGVNGSVSNVSARQIAAIAAAMDPTTLLFSSVEKISKLQADLIGYDVDGDGIFDVSLGGTGSPTTTVPADGFILSVKDLATSNGIAKNLLADARKTFRIVA